MKPYPHLLYGLLLLALPTLAQQRATILPAKTALSINKLFKDFNTRESAGYAIGIIKGQKVLMAKGYGSANLDYQLPINSRTAFDIASVSKQFTAAAIALLVIDGKLGLDDPAAKYIPMLKKYRDTITIAHLIYNTSGITDYPKLKRANGASWVTFNYFTIDQAIAASLAQDTLAFKPGSKWDYCNTNYMLLAKIVEKVSGMSFREFSRIRLFEPLGMTSTVINDDNTEVIANRATPYNHRTREILEAYRAEGFPLGAGGKWIQHPRNSPHYGGSGVSTTIDDLMKWSANFFSQGFGGNRFYQLMHDTPSFPHGRNNQAFGLYRGSFQGREYFGWDGGDFGVSTQLIHFPGQQLAIVVLSNIGTGNAAQKAEQIAGELIKAGML